MEGIASIFLGHGYTTATMSNILLIEDDSGIAAPLGLYLSRSGHQVRHIARGDEALEAFRTELPEIIVLDLNLPGVDGFSLCRSIRQESMVPIIVLSARNGENDKVQAFELGADDYVEKPFSARELVARITTVLKRAQSKPTSSTADYSVHGAFTLDRTNGVVRHAGREIRMTKTEFALFGYLLEHRGDTVSRDRLMKDIMGYEHYMFDRTVDTHVKNLRKKLEGICIVETVRGIGYRMSE